MLFKQPHSIQLSVDLLQRGTPVQDIEAPRPLSLNTHCSPYRVSAGMCVYGMYIYIYMYMYMWIIVLKRMLF